MWHNIQSEVDIESLMKIFGDFHDSCLKELVYISGAFVDENLSMHPINEQRVLKIVFQRQYSNPCVIEVEFSGIKKMNLSPCDENHTCEIHGATFFIKNSNLYWGDSSDIQEMSSYDGTWICASGTRWRIADEYLGNQEIYKPIK